jgi:hypothetical protein
VYREEAFMPMLFQVRFHVAAALVALAGVGCATVGNDFNYRAASALELGKLGAGDYKATFGPPRSTQNSSGAEGAFHIAGYVYAHGSLASVAARALSLEFKNDRLNSWIYVSGFDEDLTTVNAASADALVVRSSQKSDAQKALGTPHGRALCPSTLVDYKDRCKGAEVWAWMAMRKQGATLGKGPTESSSVFVIFDESGTVTQVEKVQTSEQR